MTEHMTDAEKAKWFDLIVDDWLQVRRGPEGWTVNQGQNGYQGCGDYDDDCEGDTLKEAYAAFRAKHPRIQRSLEAQ
jgi:hypothetical protein